MTEGLDVPRLLCGAGIGNAESVVINCGKAGNDMSRILIIEDEVAIADLEKDYLELSDFQVSICNTGGRGRPAQSRHDFAGHYAAENGRL